MAMTMRFVLPTTARREAFNGTRPDQNRFGKNQMNSQSISINRSNLTGALFQSRMAEIASSISQGP
jgi:hypothetical protein